MACFLAQHCQKEKKEPLCGVFQESMHMKILYIAWHMAEETNCLNIFD